MSNKQEKHEIDYSLYLVTDRTRFHDNRELFFEIVHQAIQGGITVVQLREKETSTRDFIDIAKRVQTLCKAANIPLIINDRIDIALAIDADGVHVGKDDMPIAIARQLIGSNKILGVTVRTPQEAATAISEGADYLGTEAIFGSQMKKYEAGPMGIDALRQLIQTVKASPHPVPVVAIGGITESNAEQVIKEAQPDGIAFVSAVMHSEHPKQVVQNLRTIFQHHKEAPLVRAPYDTQVAAKIADMLQDVRTQKPLIHHITNYVVMNDTANVTIHIGGSPVMAHAMEEVAEMVSHARAVVLNPGTLSKEWVEAMKVAGKEANRLGVPIVLDPVGAGATKYRTDTNNDLLQSLKIAVLKGNAGEIAALAGDVGKVRGVDSVGEVSNPGELVKMVAQRYGCTVVMTGAVDWVSDGSCLFTVHNGTPHLSGLTGSGCTLAAMIAAFVAVSRGNYVLASLTGLCCMEIAAEMAVESGRSDFGPASFKVAWHDNIATIKAHHVLQKAKVKTLMK